MNSPLASYPPIVQHDGRPYYQEGAVLVPVAACSCRALRDPKCAVRHHRAVARQERGLAYRSGCRAGDWIPGRQQAAQAGPALVCGCSVAQEPV